MVHKLPTYTHIRIADQARQMRITCHVLCTILVSTVPHQHQHMCGMLEGGPELQISIEIYITYVSYKTTSKKATTMPKVSAMYAMQDRIQKLASCCMIKKEQCWQKNIHQPALILSQELQCQLDRATILCSRKRLGFNNSSRKVSLKLQLFQNDVFLSAHQVGV